MSLIDAFSRTVTDSLPDGRRVEFQRVTMRMAAKLAERVKASRAAEAARQFSEAARERVAAAQASGGANPSFWLNEQAMRQGATAVKVQMVDVYAMLDDFDGVIEVLRFAGKEAGSPDADVNDYIDVAPLMRQRDVASELFASPIGDKRPVPTEGGEPTQTGTSSPPTTSPSTEPSPKTSPSAGSSTGSETSPAPLPFEAAS